MERTLREIAAHLAAEFKQDRFDARALSEFFGHIADNTSDEPAEPMRLEVQGLKADELAQAAADYAMRIGHQVRVVENDELDEAELRAAFEAGARWAYVEAIRDDGGLDESPAPRDA